MIRKCFHTLNLSCLKRVHRQSAEESGKKAVIDEGALQECIRTLRH